MRDPDILRALRHPALLVAVLVGIGGARVRDAIAQQTIVDPPTVHVANDATGVELSPPVKGSPANLTPAQRLERAKAFVGGIGSSSQSILRQLQAARKERDVVRVLCLNDKLNQVDVALRSAQDRLSALEAAVERADADRSRHEYTVLEVLGDRVAVLVNESTQCVGEETGFVGEAEVSVSIDPNLPDVQTDLGAQYNALPAPPNISSPIE